MLTISNDIALSTLTPSLTLSALSLSLSPSLSQLSPPSLNQTSSGLACAIYDAAGFEKVVSCMLFCTGVPCSGTGEQVLSRQTFRLSQVLDNDDDRTVRNGGLAHGGGGQQRNLL